MVSKPSTWKSRVVGQGEVTPYFFITDEAHAVDEAELPPAPLAQQLCRIGVVSERDPVDREVARVGQEGEGALQSESPLKHGRGLHQDVVVGEQSAAFGMSRVIVRTASWWWASSMSARAMAAGGVEEDHPAKSSASAVVVAARTEDAGRPAPDRPDSMKEKSLIVRRREAGEAGTARPPL